MIKKPASKEDYREFSRRLDALRAQAGAVDDLFVKVEKTFAVNWSNGFSMRDWQMIADLAPIIAQMARRFAEEKREIIRFIEALPVIESPDSDTPTIFFYDR